MIDVFLINAVVYLITLSYIIFKERQLSVYVLVWILETIVAVAGYVCLNMGYYYSTSYIGYKVSIIPLACIYLTTCVMTYPIKKVKPEKINFELFSKSNEIKYFVYCSLIIYVVVSILRLSESIFAINTGLGEAYTLGAEEGQRLIQYQNAILRFFSTTGSTFCNIFLPIIVFYFISLLKYNRGNKKNCLIGITIALLPSILSPLSAGSKGGLFFAFFTILFFYIMCQHLLSKKTRRTCLLFGFLALILFVVGAFAIDSSRIDKRNENTTADVTLLTYMGESMPNAAYFFYNKVRHHPYGERFFPELFNRKADQLKSLADRQYFWRNRTGVPIQMFATLWGACYIEFSFWGALIYILFLASVWNFLVLRNYKKIYMMPLVYYYFYSFLLFGIFGHGFTGWETHKWLIYLAIACWLTSFVSNRNTKKRWLSNMNSFHFEQNKDSDSLPT